MTSKRRSSQIQANPHTQENLNSTSVEEAIRCFSSEDPQELSKQRWKTYLDALEEYYERNLNDECAKCGLTQDQTHNILQSFHNWLLKAIDERTSKTKRKKLELTAFGLSKSGSSRFLSHLIPSDEIDGILPLKISVLLLSNVNIFDSGCLLTPYLKWLNCIFHYSICSTKPFEPILDLFIESLRHSKLIPVLSDIIYKIIGINKSLITSWRLKTILRLRQEKGLVLSLENLLIKIRDMRPELLKGHHLSVGRWVDQSVKSRMEKIFSSLWAKQLSADKISGCKAPLEIWGSSGPTQNFAQSVSNSRKRHSLIPAMEFSHKISFKKRKIDQLIPLSECRTVGDMYECLHNLQLPSQILSLLANPQTFALLFLNPDCTEIQERFSMTLYRVLTTEFFSLSSASGFSERKLDILKRIVVFQEWLQESIPVVEKFLVIYLKTWNGKDYFLEILRLINFVRITDFDEFNACLLYKIREHFNSTYNCPEQLLVLTYLNKLCLHWIRLEHSRNQNTITYSFFTNTSLKYSCDNPLESIAYLVSTIEALSELGLVQLTYFSKSSLTQRQKEKFMNIYISEVTSIFMVLSRCLITLEIPIRPKIPQGFIYFSIFASSAFYMTRALEVLAMTKHELIPICQKKAKKLAVEGRKNEEKVVLNQISDLDSLNTVTKDIIGVLSSSQLYLDRGASIFRKNWTVEEDEIRQNLKIPSHPAVFPLTLRFLDAELKSKPNTSRVMIYREIKREESETHHRFIEYLRDNFKVLLDSLETFDWKIRCLTFGYAASATTSGVSSMRRSGITGRGNTTRK